MPTLSELRSSPLASLEALYRDAPLAPAPSGCFRGHVLARVDNRLARGLLGDAMVGPFEWLPFGIDFARSAWFFVHPSLRLGKFRAEAGPSRWRDTEVLRLTYAESRLPPPVHGLLYDELKPLSETLCLGLGGINTGPGKGDLFFFALEPFAP